MKTSVPLYHRLKAELLQAIQSGKWQVGELIPSESVLAKEMGMSRTTIRQAVGDLVSLGYLVRRQGKGTYVAERIASFAASRLQGFAEDLRVQDKQVDIVLKSIEWVSCPDKVAIYLNGISEVIRICRVASVGGIPVFRETSYIVAPPNATVEELTQQSRFYDHIYGFFEQHGVQIAFGRQQISADRPIHEDMEDLGIRQDEPILMIRRVTSDQTGTPVEYSEVRYPSSRYQYEINLSRQGQRYS